MDRLQVKMRETAALQEAFKVRPDLFTQSSYVEDAALLRDFGIVIPGKESFTAGYLKLFPSDFIVEEIRADGTVCTIERPVTDEAVPTKVAGDDGQRALFATLVKCNISTLEAVEEIAKKLGCSAGNIHYAGLKDKNAVTAQAISFHGIDFGKLSGINGPHYFLKDMRFGKGSVEKGNLKGNRFTLFVRTKGSADEAAFNDRAQKLAQKGFYNFYWLQRFGVPRMVNYRWGFDILRGRYKETVVSYLTDSNERELPYFADLRKQIVRLVPDWKAIKVLIERYPIIMNNENIMLDYLLKSESDYLGALKAVEDQAMLWVYGVASLLFNETLSTYIQTERPLPESVPLLMSDKQEDIAFYSDFLKSIKYFPPEFKNIRPFPKIRLQHRAVQCVEKVTIDEAAFSPDGVSLRFSLKKGQYATTFLSHLFNIISGKPPEDISKSRRPVFGGTDGVGMSGVLGYFKDTDTSKADLSFESVDQAS